MYQRYYSLLLCIAMVVFPSACGGGTIGTGLTSLGESTHHSAPLSFQLEVSVVNAAGRPQPNAKVSVRSATTTVERTTNRVGIVVIPLSITPSELLQLEVRNGAKVYRADEYISPAGAKQVQRTFRLADTGDIEVLGE